MFLKKHRRDFWGKTGELGGKRAQHAITLNLSTLQQGISSAQLEEMKSEKVVLVVPQKYITTYPEKYRNDIWTVKKIIDYIKEIER